MVFEALNSGIHTAKITGKKNVNLNEILGDKPAFPLLVSTTPDESMHGLMKAAAVMRAGSEGGLPPEMIFQMASAAMAGSASANLIEGSSQKNTPALTDQSNTKDESRD